jgi:hypothetical protein
MDTHIHRLVVGVLMTVLLVFGSLLVVWTATNEASSSSVAVAQERVSFSEHQGGGDLQASRANKSDDVMSVSTDELSVSDELPEQVQLPNALEGLDTTEYRITMMLCEDKY